MVDPSTRRNATTTGTNIDLNTVLRPTWIVDDAIWLVARDWAASATQASQWRFIAAVAQETSDPTATSSESIVVEGVGVCVAEGVGMGVSVAEGVDVGVSVGAVVPQPAASIRSAAATRRREATAPVCCHVQGSTAVLLATTLITSAGRSMADAGSVAHMLLADRPLAPGSGTRVVGPVRSRCRWRVCANVTRGSALLVGPAPLGPPTLRHLDHHPGRRHDRIAKLESVGATPLAGTRWVGFWPSDCPAAERSARVGVAAGR